MLGALATVFVVPGLLLLGQGVTAALAEYAGTPGTVQVTACVPFEGKSRGWTCSGEFVADEGEFRISRVTIEPFVEQRPTAPVEARVVGPASDEAWIPSLVPLTAGGGGLAFLGLAAWIVLGVFRNDDAPEQRLSKRARRRLDRRREGGAGPPQVGNRARKRRRRRRVARPRPGA
ncbi:hypothetical protein GA0070560_104146 [Micromonospora halophytica]|uniref:Uncharacterized protein n=2 Tax=Micromonospora halophytica TaxID=47864 RepID=A0A1C5HGA0_9ACTN|nr:hypothetical protein GA0070560_104146 [Micromonospora halophytica]